MKLDHAISEHLRITNSEMLSEFIYGNNAEMTLVGPAGTAHKYLIARPKNAADFPPDIRFVYAIHDDMRFYLGMIENNKFRCTRNSKFDESCETVKGAAYIVKLSKNQSLLNTTPMRLYQSGKCARCGRDLDSELGFSRGFGKICWQKHEIQRMHEVQYNAYFRPAAFQ